MKFQKSEVSALAVSLEGPVIEPQPNVGNPHAGLEHVEDDQMPLFKCILRKE